MSDSVNTTVLFATRNRAALLGHVLDSYTRLRNPRGGWKLVIVDNDSSDGTHEVIERYARSLPITKLVEHRTGKNHALSAGLRFLAGDLVVLTDDDAFPAEDWLVELRTAVDEHASHAVFGGAIRARWEAPPPDWVLRWVPLGPVYTLTSPDLRAGPTGADTVYGPNMAVRRSALEECGGFDTSIGPSGKTYAMGSETELVRRLIKRGHAAWHVPSASVEHFISAKQLERRWILDRAVRFGRGQYRLAQRDGRIEQLATLFGVPRYLIRQLLEAYASTTMSSLRAGSRAHFDNQWRLGFVRGQVMESRRARLELAQPVEQAAKGG